MAGDTMERMASGVLRAAPPFRGKTAISWRLMERSRRAGRLAGVWQGTLRDGSELELPRTSRMTWTVACEGLYDTHLINALARYVKPGSVVLDVGASLGLWTVQLARIARTRQALVHGFEPNPANIGWINRNVKLNHLQDVVTIHEIGLGDTDTRVAFGGVEQGGAGNGHLLSPDGRGLPGATGTVDGTVALRRLDGISFTRAVSLIKLDVEGYEPSVLRGATDLLKRDRPVIFGEFAPEALEARGENLDSIIDLIGYRAFELNKQRSRFWRPRDEVVVKEPSRLAADLLLIPPGVSA